MPRHPDPKRWPVTLAFRTTEEQKLALLALRDFLGHSDLSETLRVVVDDALERRRSYFSNEKRRRQA